MPALTWKKHGIREAEFQLGRRGGGNVVCRVHCLNHWNIQSQGQCYERERERESASLHLCAFSIQTFNISHPFLLGMCVETLVVSFISSRFRREKRVGCWLYTSLYFYTRLLPFWFSIVSFLFFADCSESFKNRKDDMGEANEETTEREREEISPTLKNGSVSRLFPPFAWCSLSQTGSAVSRQRNKDRLECVVHTSSYGFFFGLFIYFKRSLGLRGEG